MGCQASPMHLLELSSLAPALGCSGRPPFEAGEKDAGEKLSDLFPQEERSFLLDIHEQTGCNLDRTIECLTALLGTSRPNSPARQDSDALQETAEQLWAHVEGSNTAEQLSANGWLADHHSLGPCDDSAASNTAHQRAASQPNMAHPDLFPAEVTSNCAQISCVDRSSAQRQPQSRHQAVGQLESLAIASLVARHRKWWPKRGVSELSLAHTHLHQRSDNRIVRDTSSSPTKLRNHTTKEAFGASASQSIHPRQVYDDLIHSQPQHTTTDRGAGRVWSQGISASQVSQTCKARPTTSQLYKQPVEQYDSHATWQSWPDCSLTGSASTAFADHPTDVVPETVEQKHHCLQQVFSNLSRMMIANALSESDFDLEKAKDKCLQLLQMEGGVTDWSESSDADTSSVAAESLAEAQSPRTWSGANSWWQLDEAEALQVSSCFMITLLCFLPSHSCVYVNMLLYVLVGQVRLFSYAQKTAYNMMYWQQFAPAICEIAL